MRKCYMTVLLSYLYFFFVFWKRVLATRKHASLHFFLIESIFITAWTRRNLVYLFFSPAPKANLEENLNYFFQYVCFAYFSKIGCYIVKTFVNCID